jgi:hypothetical protein
MENTGGGPARPLEKQLAYLQEKLQEATGLLDEGIIEYGRLYHSRFNLLEGIARTILQMEGAGQAAIAQDLKRLLALQGVRLFTPEIGKPVPRERCRTSKIHSAHFPVGMVATVSAPGFISDDGEVILPAEVFESEGPSEGGQGTLGETIPARTSKNTDTRRKRKPEVPAHSQIIPGTRMVKEVRENLGDFKRGITDLEKETQQTTERLQLTFQRYSLLNEKLRLLSESSRELIQSFDPSQPATTVALNDKIAKLKRVVDGR